MLQNDGNLNLVYKLAGSLMEDNILITGVDTDTFICITPRKGRTDSDIDVTMRKAKIKVMMVYKETVGQAKDIKLRYKVVTEEEYSRVSAEMVKMLR